MEVSQNPGSRSNLFGWGAVSYGTASSLKCVATNKWVQRGGFNTGGGTSLIKLDLLLCNILMHGSYAFKSIKWLVFIGFQPLDENL